MAGIAPAGGTSTVCAAGRSGGGEVEQAAAKSSGTRGRAKPFTTPSLTGAGEIDESHGWRGPLQSWWERR